MTRGHRQFARLGSPSVNSRDSTCSKLSSMMTMQRCITVVLMIQLGFGFVLWRYIHECGDSDSLANPLTSAIIDPHPPGERTDPRHRSRRYGLEDLKIDREGMIIDPNIRNAEENSGSLQSNAQTDSSKREIDAHSQSGTSDEKSGRIPQKYAIEGRTLGDGSVSLILKDEHNNNEQDRNDFSDGFENEQKNVDGNAKGDSRDASGESSLNSQTVREHQNQIKQEKQKKTKEHYDYVVIPNHRGSVHHIRNGPVQQYNYITDETMSGLIDARYFNRAEIGHKKKVIREWMALCDGCDECAGFSVHSHLHYSDVHFVQRDPPLTHQMGGRGYYSRTASFSSSQTDPSSSSASSPSSSAKARSNSEVYRQLWPKDRYQTEDRFGGALFYNVSVYPLQYMRGWVFYLKNSHDRQTRMFEEQTKWHQNFGLRNYPNPRRSEEEENPSLSNDNHYYFFYDYSQKDLMNDNRDILGYFLNDDKNHPFAQMTYDKIPLLRRDFLSFEWNVGRTNNQIMSFEAVLQYAIMYQRTILLPFGSHFNHFQGIFYDGLWDLNYLSLFIDFAYEFELGNISNPHISDLSLMDDNDIDNDNGGGKIRVLKRIAQKKLMNAYYSIDRFHNNNIINQNENGNLMKQPSMMQSFGAYNFETVDLLFELLSGNEVIKNKQHQNKDPFWQEYRYAIEVAQRLGFLMSNDKNDKQYNISDILENELMNARIIRDAWNSIGLFNKLEYLWFRQYSLHDTLTGGTKFGSETHPCHVSSGVRYNIDANRSLKSCRLIHLSNGRWNHFKIENIRIWDVIQWFIPAPYIRRAVEEFITSKFYYSSNGFRIGLHRRAMKEGGHDSVTGSPYVCRYFQKSASKGSYYSRMRDLVNKSIMQHWKNGVQSWLKESLKNNPELLASKQRAMEMINDENITDVMKAEKAAGILDMYDRTCAMRIEDIFEFLSFHKQSPLILAKDDSGQSGTKGEQWFLATDGQEPEILQSWMDDYGAVTFNDDIKWARFQRTRPKFSRGHRLAAVYNDYGIRCNQAYHRYLNTLSLSLNTSLNRNGPDLPRIEKLKRLNKEYDKQQPNGRTKNEFAHFINEVDAYQVESAVFDMWTLSKSEFFIGSWHSTLTRTVCHWRGWDRMYQGTNCYLSYKWDRTWKSGDLSWFDLSAVDKPKLSWAKHPKRED